MTEKKATAAKMEAVKKPARKVVKMPIKISSYIVISRYLEQLGVLRRNAVTKEIELNGAPLSEESAKAVYIRLTIDADGGDRVTPGEFFLYLGSSYVETYNPVTEFFKAADGANCSGSIKNLSLALIRDPEQGMTAETTELFLTKWLVGMVASWLGPYHNPLMLCLTGPKNSGKTYFFRHLLPDDLAAYFAESVLKAGKDDEAKACEYLIILVDEMDFLVRGDAANIRRFLSADKFTYRVPYGKSNQKFKRYASFCGTSNEASIISDRGDNRRIIPICIKSVDHKRYNSQDKKNLFFEAYQLYKSGYDWQLSSNDIAELEAVTVGNEVTVPEADLLPKHFVQGDEFLTATEILTVLSYGNRIQLSTVRLGKVLKEAGFTRVSRRGPGGIPKYGWLVSRVDAFDELL